MVAGGKRVSVLWWSAVAAAALGGLLLRVLAARGGLWTDEAWSMIYASQARDAAGVFLRINHDNNHHLNTLWLQAIGLDAPLWLGRLPAIIAGTASVLLAAVLAGGKSRPGGIVAAIFFAVSPAMVTLGSEARGYALMLLAVLIMLLIAIEAIEHGSRRSMSWWLAAVALVGMLSHLTMAAPVALVTLWVYLDRRDNGGSNEAFRSAARLMGPAILATIAVATLVVAAALASPTGMRVGGYVPFASRDYWTALDELSGWATGLSPVPPWLRLLAIGAAAAAVVLRPPDWLGSRGRLFAILTIGVPLAALLLRPGNAGFARYYATSLIGFFLLLAAVAGRAITLREAGRWAAVTAVVVMTALNLVEDRELIRLQRGRPDAPLAEVTQMSPRGARVAVNPRYVAIMALAARRTGYRLQLAKDCVPAGFVLAPRPIDTAVPSRVAFCGRRMRLIDSSTTSPMTGDAWALYGAETLQTKPPPVSGPPPGARNSRLSGRAGVAQG